jgi:hypothetical protein
MAHNVDSGDIEAEARRLERVALGLADPRMARDYMAKAAELRKGVDADLTKAVVVEKAAGRPDPVVAIRRGVNASLADVGSELRAARGRIAANRPGVVGMTSKATTSTRPAFSTLSGNEKAARYEELATKAASPAEAASLRRLAHDARKGA